VRLQGGLGNQMFQYALGRVLSLKYKTDLGLDTSFYSLTLKPKRLYDLDFFNIYGKVVTEYEIPFLYKMCQKNAFLFKILNKIRVIKGKERFFHFDPQVFSFGDGVYLNGYWQSYKYFKGYEDVLRKDFTFKKQFSQDILDLAEEIKKTNSLSINIRRGDYVGNKLYDVLDNDYYDRGIEYVTQKTQIDKIYVFSDDVNWCKQNLSFPIPTIFVEEKYMGLDGEGHLFLMSMCNNFIIPNSTFGWWGAWLSDYQNKIVITPKKWFADVAINISDLIPDSWIRI